jgi:hypothetical protein
MHAARLSQHSQMRRMEKGRSRGEFRPGADGEPHSDAAKRGPGKGQAHRRNILARALFFLIPTTRKGIAVC